LAEFHFTRSQSGNRFSWIARSITGANDLRLHGTLYDFTNGDAEARAVAGNRSMVVQAVELSANVY